ncbi:hypothetical protein GRX03_15325 [Halovenus sp. WSH3]|uniref:Uncharacterized protein n=1 Tax=Halovenus carboxidivorans TaxID=2692199 RepID=A0A6B0TDG8_9EURY|nr:hypothetical protein [Halovenus carboxidivorans]MXR52970.1 hypothetical protein [Halovenus carboxidivorans]
MITFGLREITAPDDWESVTAGMAPDGVAFDVEIRGETCAHRTSLTNLIGLYLCVREGDRSACEQCPYDIDIVGADQVRLNDNYMLDLESENITLDRSDVVAALEPFVTEICRQLDRQSTAEEREAGLEYLQSVFDFDAAQFHREHTGR